MKLFALYTGGKDSTAAILHAINEGYAVDALLVMRPKNPESYMFHTINLKWTYLQSISMNIPIYYFKSSGIKEKELEDLSLAFKKFKELGFDGVIIGAIASTYQYNRVNNVAKSADLRVYAPLWNIDQEELLNLYITYGIKFMIVSVSALGLEKKHLGWIIKTKEDIEEIIKLANKFGFNPTGEGGEYESYVIDAPIFKYYIDVVKYDIIWLGDSGYLKIKEAYLREKS